jgi:hypothetical protein
MIHPMGVSKKKLMRERRHVKCKKRKVIIGWSGSKTDKIVIFPGTADCNDVV